MLHRVRARSHAFFGNFYAADLLANGETNDLIEVSFSKRPLRSATCSAAANAVRVVASARPELG
ncbi:MAG: hypothetical protein DMF03_11805 [Verrucomicrobia bacterium]|nr:MAG: hypothetical protein DMF03_11805 [Verrucomicrobiota bacterium]